jgi:DNA-binding transcriptional regulator YiaG
MSSYVSDRERAWLFVAEVKQHLQEWGVSQSEFAFAVGVFPSSVSLWFRHMQQPNEGSILRMRNAMRELNERYGFSEDFNAEELP